jgi:hypothetical protein
MKPGLPSRIGKTTQRKYMDGSPMSFTVLDEIVHVPASNQKKAIYLQMLKFADDGRTEMRLCYYVLGHRGRIKGKWAFGQFAPMIRKEDFDKIISKAREKGWVT